MSSSQVVVTERCQFGVGDCIDGRWRVESFLGEGTFGQVFRVKDSAGGTYALKLLKLWEIMASERPNLLSRFEREYETGRIQSEYLVHSLHKGIVKGNAYIVMEYCQGGDFCSALKKKQLDLALLSNHILLGLRDLHQNGKVHRDIKPENVLLKSDTHAVLTDFGISGDRNNRLTQRGWLGVPTQCFGTIAYMPPEQVKPKSGNATVLPTTDIFSFGVMMYQLLTGNLPFGDLNTSADVPRYVYNGEKGVWDRERLRSVSGGDRWSELIEGCLVPDFKNRLQTTDDVLRLVPAHRFAEEFIRQNSRALYNKDCGRGILLRIMQGEELDRVYSLNTFFTDGGSVLYIGRKSDGVWNHIGIQEKESCYISRQHCTIEKDAETNRWILRDGQCRVSCEIGLRTNRAFPCWNCTARCPHGGCGPMTWKKSLNGTFVNSSEVPPEGFFILPGDIISIGDVKMRVEGV